MGLDARIRRADYLRRGASYEYWDYQLNRRWLYLFNPDLVWFAQNVLDSIAGQAVCLPVLATVAITLARIDADPGVRSDSRWRRRRRSTSASGG